MSDPATNKRNIDAIAEHGRNERARVDEHANRIAAVERMNVELMRRVDDLTARLASLTASQHGTGPTTKG